LTIIGGAPSAALAESSVAPLRSAKGLDYGWLGDDGTASDAHEKSGSADPDSFR
jgi:hypothetical protein